MLESGIFWLLFWAVAKKYARTAGTPLEKRNGLRSRSDALKVRAAHNLSGRRPYTARSACTVHEVHAF